MYVTRHGYFKIISQIVFSPNLAKAVVVLQPPKAWLNTIISFSSGNLKLFWVYCIPYIPIFFWKSIYFLEHLLHSVLKGPKSQYLDQQLYHHNPAFVCVLPIQYKNFCKLLLFLCSFVQKITKTDYIKNEKKNTFSTKF